MPTFPSAPRSTDFPPGASRRSLLAATSALLASPWLVGCGTPEPMLRVASNVWPGYETLYLARQLGRYDPHRIRLVEMPSATDVLRALSTNLIEGAALTLDEMLSVRAAGLDLVAVLVFDISNGADALLARPDIGNLAALAGRRVGVEQSAVGALVLDAALRAGGLGPADVRQVFLTVDRHQAAFEAGAVDAIVTFEPVASALVRQGAQRLFDSSRMPGAIVDVLALQRHALERQPQALRTLLAGHFEALWQISRSPDQMLPYLQPRLRQRPSEILQSLRSLIQPDLPANHRWLGGEQPQLRRSAQALQRVMVSAGLLGELQDLSTICSAAWLPPAGAAGASA